VISGDDLARSIARKNSSETRHDTSGIMVDVGNVTSCYPPLSMDDNCQLTWTPTVVIWVQL